MINTLNIATQGYLANQTPLSLATLGWITDVVGDYFFPSNAFIWSLGIQNTIWDTPAQGIEWNLSSYKRQWNTALINTKWSLKAKRYVWTLRKEI